MRRLINGCDTIVFIKFASVSRIANTIPVIVNYPAVLKQKAEHIDLRVLACETILPAL